MRPGPAVVGVSHCRKSRKEMPGPTTIGRMEHLGLICPLTGERGHHVNGGEVGRMGGAVRRRGEQGEVEERIEEQNETALHEEEY